MKDIKILRFDIRDNDNFEKAKNIRKAVFLEEYYLDQFLEYDGLDRQATHYLVYKENKAVGTARWRTTYGGIKLERLAILKNYRNQNIGKLLINKMLKDVQSMDMDIYLNACASAVNFFQKPVLLLKVKNLKKWMLRIIK